MDSEEGNWCSAVQGALGLKSLDADGVWDYLGEVDWASRWPTLLFYFAVLVFLWKSRRPAAAKQPPALYTNAHSGERRAAPKADLGVAALLRTDVSPSDCSVAGKTDLQPGMLMRVADPLCELDGKVVSVHRVDGALVMICPQDGCIGPCLIARRRLVEMKKEPHVRVAYVVHRNGCDSEESSVAVKPFSTVADVRRELCAALSLKPFQFHLIHAGAVVQADGELAAKLAPGPVRVFVRKETLEKGYRPPPPQADPSKREAIYDFIVRSAEDAERRAENTPPAYVVEGDTNELIQFLHQHERVVVDFFAPWCGPCKAIAPHFAALAQSPDSAKVAFFKIDADKHSGCRQRWHVSGYPTFIAFKNGVESSRMSGASTDELERLVRGVAS